jgi:hypothetical protein
MTTKTKQKNNKVKIGLVIDSELHKRIKEKAIREGRTISNIIHEALLKYGDLDQPSLELRQEAARRFLSRPSNLSLNELNEILDEDNYDA